MTLSDRLVDARFSKQADGSWEYAPLPFVRRYILNDENKTAIEERSKILQPGAVLVVSSLFVKISLLPLVALLTLVSIKFGTLSVEASLWILGVVFFSPDLALIYVLANSLRLHKRLPRIPTPLKNAERGRRLGYFEYMIRIGRVIGRRYTWLLLFACVSGVLFWALLGSQLTDFSYNYIVPSVVTVALLPLFWHGLRVPATASA